MLSASVFVNSILYVEAGLKYCILFKCNIPTPSNRCTTANKKGGNLTYVDYPLLLTLFQQNNFVTTT